MATTNLISIVGAGHSGSTLLDLVLGSHSKIFSVGEITHWDKYVVENKICSCGSPTHSCEFWKDIVSDWKEHQAKVGIRDTVTNTSSNSFQGVVNSLRYRACLLLTLALPMHKFPSALHKTLPETRTRINNILDLYGTIRRASDKPILCDSSKSVYRFRLLHARDPKGTKAIFLTRDGRAIAASSFRRTGKDPVKSARKWKLTNIYTQYMLRTLPKDTYIHIRYEEFCREPEKTLKKIFEFIGIPFETAMLEFSESTAHNIGGNRMRMNAISGIKEDLKWREVLSNEQLNAFDKIAGRTNARLLGDYM